MNLSYIIQFSCVAVFTVFLAKWMINYYKFHRKIEKLPLFKGAVPIFGHMKQFFGDTGNFWKSIKAASRDANDGEGIVTIKMGPLHHIVVTDPILAFNILNKCFNKNYLYKFGQCWLGNGIIEADADIWKVNRKLINPTFSQHVLNGFIGVFNSQAKWLVEELKSDVDIGPFDPRRKMTIQTLKTVCQTVLGIANDDDGIIDEEYLDAVERIFKIIAYRMVNVHIHPSFVYSTTSQKREQDKCVKILHNMSRSMMLKRKEERDNGNRNENLHSANRFTASLDLLLGMAEKGQLGLEQIRMELDTLIAAGHDTSNRAVLYTLIYIGSYPEVQQKIYEEIQSVVGSKEFIDKDDLPKLVYTEAVIKESLRVSPVVPLIGRILDQDIKHNNYVLPKSVNAIISIWGIHHSEKIWGPDVKEFKPERWMNPDAFPTILNSYCPFSMGKRNCIGKHYAYMSMKVTLGYLVRNYKISADYTKLRTNFDVLLRAMEGYEISLQLR